jgi:hypothetical protein
MNHRTPAKDVRGNFGEFKNFMRRLMAVPHSEIKAALDAEKKRKAERRSRAFSSASGRVSSDKG